MGTLLSRLWFSPRLLALLISALVAVSLNAPGSANRGASPAFAQQQCDGTIDHGDLCTGTWNPGVNRPEQPKDDDEEDGDNDDEEEEEEEEKAQKEDRCIGKKGC